MAEYQIALPPVAMVSHNIAAMSKTLVAYYSHTGNNLFLAHRVARHLDADLEELRPRLGLFFFLILFTWLGWSPGIRPLRHQVQKYDQLVLLGPIWFGKLISPLRDCIRKYRDAGVAIHFATCCGGQDEMKDDTFGYEGVFRQARALGGESISGCTAFPVLLAIPPEQRDQPEAGMKTRLNEDNFTGDLLDRLHRSFPVASLL